MLFSHRFGSAETLSRARYWMTRLGFEIAPTDPASHDVSRLVYQVDLSQASAVQALIDSIEGTDPEGWPGFMTPSPRVRRDKGHAPSAFDAIAPDPERTPIHWQGRDDAATADPVCSRVREYMLSRWE